MSVFSQMATLTTSTPVVHKVAVIVMCLVCYILLAFQISFRKINDFCMNQFMKLFFLNRIYFHQE